MQLYLSMGHGNLLGEHWLNKIYDLGFAGIRVEVLKNWKPIVDELGQFGKLSPVFQFGSGDMGCWQAEDLKVYAALAAKHIEAKRYFTEVPVYFEIGNKPDLAVREWREDFALFNDTFWECYHLAKTIRSDIRMITGGISNLNKHALDYLNEFLQDGLPGEAIIGFNRLSNGPDIEKPHIGFHSRVHEMNRLMSLCNGHRAFCTETGLSQGPYKVGMEFPLCWLNKTVRLSEVEQGKALEKEWNFYKRYGVEGMAWQQHRDSYSTNYGIYHTDGREKFSCEVVKKISRH